MGETNVRALALRLLLSWESEDKFINLVLEDAEARRLPEEEKRFLTALLYGTVERRITLDYIITALAERPAQGLAPHTRCLLQLGLYQLLYMDGIPDFAAVNETVALAANRGERGFVNALLREAKRSPDRYALPDRAKDVATYLSLAYAFPRNLVRHLLREYGEETAEGMLSFFNRTQPLTLRVNTQKTTRSALLAMLREAGVEAEETVYAPNGIRLAASANPTALPGFEEGLFYVQDEASQIAVAALGATGAGLVIDTCACPGGKSFGAAMDIGAGGEVLSFDLHESKLPLITEGAARLSLSNIRAEVHNGEEPRADLLGKADRVLCDAPCSGIGVLGKKAALRHRAARRPDLPDLQKRILFSAAKYVKKGGVLVYSTCTLNRAENEAVAEEFLAAHPQFAPTPFSVGGLNAEDGSITLLPPVHGTDGFFIAKFKYVQD